MSVCIDQMKQLVGSINLFTSQIFLTALTLWTELESLSSHLLAWLFHGLRISAQFLGNISTNIHLQVYAHKLNFETLLQVIVSQPIVCISS